MIEIRCLRLRSIKKLIKPELSSVVTLLSAGTKSSKIKTESSSVLLAH